MIIRCLPVGPLQANCYLVKPDDAPTGVIIDPGGEPEHIARECRAMGMTPSAILLTHGHFDHVGAVGDLLARWRGLSVYFHPGDEGDDPRDQLAWRPVPGVRYYGDGEQIALGGLTFRVLHTPGHSPGSVTLLCGRALFTGDTLFQRSIGRTDFPGGSYPQILASLRRLAALEGDYKVYPGHNGFTTLDQERRHNPFLLEALEGMDR